MKADSSQCFGIHAALEAGNGPSEGFVNCVVSVIYTKCDKCNDWKDSVPPPHPPPPQCLVSPVTVHVVHLHCACMELKTPRLFSDVCGWKEIKEVRREKRNPEGGETVSGHTDNSCDVLLQISPRVW